MAMRREELLKVAQENPYRMFTGKRSPSSVKFHTTW